MSFFRVGASVGPLRNALLISAAAHLLVLMSGGFRMASGVGESTDVNKNLPALLVAVTRPPLSSEGSRPVAAGRTPSITRPVDQPSVLTTADPASVPPASVSIESSGGGATVPRAVVVTAAALPVDVSVADSKVVVSGGETALPDGYLDAVRGYRISLASHAKRYRLYPPAAREMGIGGLSEIEIVVPVANSPEFRVRKSSGHEELDRAALEMLRRSVETVELPPPLRGRRLSISLPVEFLPPP